MIIIDDSKKKQRYYDDDEKHTFILNTNNTHFHSVSHWEIIIITNIKKSKVCNSIYKLVVYVLSLFKYIYYLIRSSFVAVAMESPNSSPKARSLMQHHKSGTDYIKRALNIDEKSGNKMWPILKLLISISIDLFSLRKLIIIV